MIPDLVHAVGAPERVRSSSRRMNRGSAYACLGTRRAEGRRDVELELRHRMADRHGRPTDRTPSAARAHPRVATESRIGAARYGPVTRTVPRARRGFGLLRPAVSSNPHASTRIHRYEHGDALRHNRMACGSEAAQPTALRAASLRVRLPINRRAVGRESSWRSAHGLPLPPHRPDCAAGHVTPGSLTSCSVHRGQ